MYPISMIFTCSPQCVSQVTSRTVGAFFSYSLSLIIKNQLFGVSLGFRLASSCGKWCHHLSLGCGYLNELWTWSLWCQLLQWNRKLGSSPCFKANPKSILDISSYSTIYYIYQWYLSSYTVVLEWVEIKNLFELTLLRHSSEIRGLCLMKWPGETLQNLPYFI